MGETRLRLGMGCMRLSTERDRDEARAIAVVHAGLDAGVRLLDTADVYCRDDTEIGHNERLLRRALETWSGPRAEVEIATKGGLRRPGGRWTNDARGKQLAEACERSRRALGVERIDLYLLHAPDPRVPLLTSVRSLKALQRDGRLAGIGLSNVSQRQLEEARAIAEIAAVEIELSPFREDGFRSGVPEYCAANGIRLLAHRPLGGADSRARLERDGLLGLSDVISRSRDRRASRTPARWRAPPRSGWARTTGAGSTSASRPADSCARRARPGGRLPTPPARSCW